MGRSTKTLEENKLWP